MRIGEFARRAGVTARTVRYYESLGLLEPGERQGSGFRYYTEAELARLQKINDLKELGLSLEEIISVVPLYFEDPTRIRGKQKILEILKAHLQETDEKLTALAQFRAELQAKINQIEQWLEEQTQREGK
ncbi:MAG: MerR family transcriptional regulator [Leptolyngbya sp. IPPAS B-1204]|uniref:MerR family transcriptional regulator n=2 Tax=Leptolyngbya sp. NK1-12 TaxID=2547451 RepID=A0AA97ANE8_9CYAN|nr:MerR family transcriptional regulator [Elainella sp. C42_A2020_010]RNJ66669.1 MAG: MerR family transcriptional regulator [Leptolyngbya sp. IPPAS B-1204]WNZ26732.1 MerR family transcriptional regulator [Leptolyngbya sp. NK1-12]